MSFSRRNVFCVVSHMVEIQCWVDICAYIYGEDIHFRVTEMQVLIDGVEGTNIG